jgi:uncharacterized protein (TIGR02270 family)
MTALSTRDTRGASAAVLWDVVDEHLAEAAFGLEQFERALQHPTRTLADLDRYPEARLLAHLDALVIAGPAVWARLLAPLLQGSDEPEPACVLAAALVFVRAGEYEPIWHALAQPNVGIARAVVRAAALGGAHDFDRRLTARAELATTSGARASLLELIALRGLTPPTLFEALQHEDAAVVAAAARAALHADARTHLPIVESLLEHPAPAVQQAALLVALAWSSTKAWALCQRLAHETGELQALAMQLVASLGGRAQQARLLERLRDPHAKHAAIFALGSSGNITLLPTLLEHVASKDPLAAKLAAQAISSITGLDLRDNAFAVAHAEAPDTSLPSLAADDLEAELVPAPEAALPTPDAAAIAAHLHAHAASFHASTRYVRGHPASLASLLDALESAPLRQRHGLALALTARAGAALRFDTRLFSSEQRTRLASLRTLAANHTLRAFSTW